MPVRLKVASQGQAANTLYWGTGQAELLAAGVADDDVQFATDYQELSRIIMSATANVIRTARVYLMNSASTQTLTLGPTGYYLPGTVLSIVQMGSAKTTLVAGTGVTINTALSTLVTGGQFAVGQLLKTTAADTWLAFGGFGG